MRQLIFAALAVLTLSLVQSAPATARTHWQCMGPPASCVKAKPATRKYGYIKQKKAKKRTAYKSKYKSKKSRSVTSSYGGGYSGMASYYWQPQRVASGGWFNPNALTAAHKTLPFGTKVRVTNKRNGRSVTVTINDRGPYIKGRIIDLSSRAAGVIGMKGAGVVPVSITVLGRG